MNLTLDYKERNMKAFGAILPALMATLQQEHRASPVFFSAGLDCMALLSRQEDNALMIGELGGLSVILTILATYGYGSAEICRAVCMAIGMMTRSPANKATFVEMGTFIRVSYLIVLM